MTSRRAPVMSAGIGIGSGSGSGSGMSSNDAGGSHKYQRLPVDEEQQPSLAEHTTTVQSDSNSLLDSHSEEIRPRECCGEPELLEHLKNFRKKREQKLCWIIMGVIGIVSFLYWAVFSGIQASASSCDDWKVGYTCQPEISHFWGQYSPYFEVESELPTTVPAECKITFAQVLHRHGARDPTASKTAKYNATIAQIHANTVSYSQSYAFLQDYVYTLQADQLSTFGQQEMVNAGRQFYERYNTLTRSNTPFVRASGEARVVESAKNWTQGFHTAKVSYYRNDTAYPYNIVEISEEAGSNNTLDHGLCTNFEEFSTTGDDAQADFSATFFPPITARINMNLPGANITDTQTNYIMDLCPFETVHDVAGTISPFCALFTEKEWHQYDYFQSVGKFYGYGPGNALGPTQGVGFTNELIARLTNSPVVDHTSTNRTLDTNPLTFPIDGKTKLYADFSHDNDMTAIYSALGFYNSTELLSNTTVTTAQAANGYSASWTAAFAARMYVEKMQCDGEAEELVRVLVNGRVLPLETCDGDRFGRCGLGAFVQSLSFAKAGGHWDQCFT